MHVVFICDGEAWRIQLLVAATSNVNNHSQVVSWRVKTQSSQTTELNYKDRERFKLANLTGHRPLRDFSVPNANPEAFQLYTKLLRGASNYNTLLLSSLFSLRRRVSTLL